MKTQFKILTLAIAAFNLVQASEQGNDLGLPAERSAKRSFTQGVQCNQLETVEAPSLPGYFGSLWNYAKTSTYNLLSSAGTVAYNAAAAPYRYVTAYNEDPLKYAHVKEVKAAQKKAKSETQDSIAGRVKAAHTEEAKAAQKKAAVAAKGKKKGKKLAQVPVIVKRRAVEDPTSAAAKIEALPYVAEEALMNSTNKKEKAKIKKGLKELSDRRERIAISMEESAKLENAIETAWKKADAIKKREEIKQNKAAVKEARIATKKAIRIDAARRIAQAEKSGMAPELTTQQKFNKAKKNLRKRLAQFNIKK